MENHAKSSSRFNRQAWKHLSFPSEVYSTKWKTSQRRLLPSGANEKCSGVSCHRVLECLAPMALKKFRLWQVKATVDYVCLKCYNKWEGIIRDFDLRISIKARRITLPFSSLGKKVSSNKAFHEIHCYSNFCTLRIRVL